MWYNLLASVVLISSFFEEHDATRSATHLNDWFSGFGPPSACGCVYSVHIHHITCTRTARASLSIGCVQKSGQGVQEWNYIICVQTEFKCRTIWGLHDFGVSHCLTTLAFWLYVTAPRNWSFVVCSLKLSLNSANDARRDTFVSAQYCS